MNLLLDTNVVIDYLGRKAPFFNSAKRIIAAGYFGDAKIWVSSVSIKDAFYVLSHYVDSTRIQQSFVKLNEVVSFVSVSEEDVMRAACLGWSDFENCLIAQCAEKAKADYLITRDLKGFDRSLIPFMHPDEWLEEMAIEERLEYGDVEFDSEGEPKPALAR